MQAPQCQGPHQRSAAASLRPVVPMTNPPPSRSDRIALTAILGPLLVCVLMLVLCAQRKQTLADCDRDKQIPMLALAVSTAVFSWLAKPPQ